MAKRMDVNAAIKEAVNAGLQAGRMDAANDSRNAYKDTERRLYAYPILINRIAENRERLREYVEEGAPGRSKDVARFGATGVRITQEEALEALTANLEKRIAADEYEVDAIKRALETISDDPHYQAVAGKFIEKKTDDEIAEEIHCDPSTVRRNRGRLMRMLAIWLYGVEAI